MELSEFKKYAKDKRSSEKSFGITISVFLVCYFLLFQKNQIILALLVTAPLIFVSFFFPIVLKIPNKLWMMFGEILGKIVTPIVMVLIFFLVVTPFGIFLRSIGKLQFKYRFDEVKDSFWNKRKENIFTAEQFERQF